MLQGISWSAYLEAAVIATAIYYTCVAATFYRSEIKGLLKPGANKEIQQAATNDGTAAFEDLESLVHEIDSILEQAGNQATKDELLPQLRAKLASYGGLRQPAYRAAVFNHIIQQAEEICGIRITEGELAG